MACDPPPPPAIISSASLGAMDSARPTASVAATPLRGDPADTLRLRRTIVDPTGFRRLRRLAVVGDALVAADQLQSPHMSVFRVSDGSLIHRLGAQGTGDGQVIDPAWIIPVAAQPPEAWVFDYQRQRLLLVRLTAPPDSAISEVIPLRTSGWITQPIWIGGRLIANGLFSDFTLALLDRTGKTVSRIAADPPFDSSAYADSAGRATLNRNELAADPAGKRFVLAYHNVNRLDFFHATGARYASVMGPRPAIATFSEHEGHLAYDKDARIAYAQVEATPDHVYALFCGCPRGRPQAYPTTLHVFTWDGAFVREIAFDRPVLGMAIDGDARLFAHFLTPLPEIGEFSLDGNAAMARRPLVAAGR